MMDNKTSSNRHLQLKGAALHQQKRCVGAVRLPLTRQADFVDDFNRIYQSIGMSLKSTDSFGARKNPGDANITEDF